MPRTNRYFLFSGLLVVFGTWLSLFYPRLAWAGTDLTFTCQKHTCQLNKPYQPMFSESNIQPGDGFSQKLVLNNKSDELGYFYLYLTLTSQKDQANLAKTLVVSIDEISTNHLQKILPDTFLVNLINQKQSVKLGPVLPDETKTYLVNFSFDPNTDNSFQAKFAKFNLHFGLEFLGEATSEKLTQLETQQRKATSSLDSLTQPSIGQVLGAKTSISDDLQSSLRATAIKHPWLKRVGPFIAAILVMVLLLGLVFTGWWLWLILSKKRRR